MEIFGKSYGFRYTVGAEEEIRKLCPGEDLSKLRDLLRGKTPESLAAAAETMCILSRWEEKARRFEDPEHREEPLTRELLALCTPAEFTQLLIEALQAIVRDRSASVEAQPEKKEKAPRSN